MNTKVPASANIATAVMHSIDRLLMTKNRPTILAQVAVMIKSIRIL